ncbi:Gcd10p-domain-containing protein [Wallemia mellicola]|nr:Gcd10p-domain-containing protein [Wallemia mellicola]
MATKEDIERKYDIRCDFISEGDSVLIRLPSLQEKVIKLSKNGFVGFLKPYNSTANFGKFGKVAFSELVGKPYGLSYEIIEKDGKSTLKRMSHKAVDDIVYLEDFEATNQFIEDDTTAITLLGEAEIDALKKGGVEGRKQIIEQQIAAHGQFDLKTAYSKEKYLKKKEAKFLKFITPIAPTTFNVCEYHFNKNPSRIRDLRVDTLSQMLTLGNIQQGGRYLVVEETSGLLTAAILERLGGEGSVLLIHDADSPPNLDILESMNLPEESIRQSVRHLNWVTIEEDFVNPPLKLEAKEGGENWKSHHERDKILKRKEQLTALENLRKEFFDGDFDGLICASQYEPYGIVDKLHSRLSGSAPVVLHHPHLAVLTEAHMKLRNSRNFLSPVVSESWLRQYQVLPGRTHPNMQMSATGGYLLHTLRVFDDPLAHSVKAVKRRKTSDRN